MYHHKLCQSRSITTFSAAFSNPHGKAAPHLHVSLSPVHALITNSRALLNSQTRPKSVDNLFSLFKADPHKKENKELKEKEKENIGQIKKRLKSRGYLDIGDSQIVYALDSKSAAGDITKAVDLLVLFQESVKGVIEKYDPSITMLGAVNREAVTCYLDSVLFAMFAKLDSFEPILYKNFEDDARKNLSMLIRLWVNMMRSGQLIDTDIVCFPRSSIT